MSRDVPVRSARCRRVVGRNSRSTWWTCSSASRAETGPTTSSPFGCRGFALRSRLAYQAALSHQCPTILATRAMSLPGCTGGYVAMTCRHLSDGARRCSPTQPVLVIFDTYLHTSNNTRTGEGKAVGGAVLNLDSAVPM